MTERKWMSGRELLNNLQALSEEILARPFVVRHPNGGYSYVSHTDVLSMVQLVLHLDPGPTEAESKAELKEVEDALWADSRVEEDGSVAFVDPADLKNMWAMQSEVQTRAQAHGLGQSGGAISRSLFANACSSGADVTAVWYRLSILRMLAEHLALLSSWLHDGKLDECRCQIPDKASTDRSSTAGNASRCPGIHYADRTSQRRPLAFSIRRDDPPF